MKTFLICQVFGAITVKFYIQQSFVPTPYQSVDSRSIKRFKVIMETDRLKNTNARNRNGKFILFSVGGFLGKFFANQD